MPRLDPRSQLCGNCGHWSESSESGLVTGTGYCNFWEKLTDQTYACDHFMSRRQYARMQQDLAARNEDYLDDG